MKMDRLRVNDMITGWLQELGVKPGDDVLDDAAHKVADIIDQVITDTTVEVKMPRHRTHRRHSTFTARIPRAMLKDPRYFSEHETPTSEFDQWMCDNGVESDVEYDDDGDPTVEDLVYEVYVQEEPIMVGMPMLISNGTVITLPQTLHFKEGDWDLGFSEESSSEAWWVELQLLSPEDHGLTTPAVLSLSDVEALRLADCIYDMVRKGRKEDFS